MCKAETRQVLCMHAELGTLQSGVVLHAKLQSKVPIRRHSPGSESCNQKNNSGENRRHAQESNVLIVLTAEIPPRGARRESDVSQMWVRREPKLEKLVPWKEQFNASLYP
jgi:hypothetical protein